MKNPVLILCLTMLLGCTSALADEAAAAAAAEAAATMTVDELVAAAQSEGQLFSVGMPDEWANWKSLWAYITDTYGINHSDTDIRPPPRSLHASRWKARPTRHRRHRHQHDRCGHGAGPAPALQAHDLGFHPRLRQGRKRKMDHGLYLHHRLHDRP